MGTQRATRTRRLTAAAMVIAIALAACSGDDDDSSSSTVGTQPEETSSVDTTPADTAAPDTEAPDTVPTEPDFVFGYVRPPTGIQSQLAIAQETALNLAIDDINAAGGVNGAPAGLVIVDEPLDGDTSVAIDGLLELLRGKRPPNALKF